MTDSHWISLINKINGKASDKLLSGFIIDCPWLPNWAGISIMDYFSNEDLWFQSHLKAAQTFPETIFLPGFWSEFGMCTEPSAFGAKCSFPENEFPHAHQLFSDIDQVDKLSAPNPRTDGLLPFMLKRLSRFRQKMEDNGHQIRFSVSRGPLNIASYLMGTTEFLMSMLMNPVKTHQLIRIITDFIHQWHDLQKKTFESIDGIMILDDIIGFMSKDQFEEFGLPYFKELYNRPASIRLLHNDAPSRESARYLPEMNVNFFNMGIDIEMRELIEMTDHKVVMLGNLPPRDVLAIDTPDGVYMKTRSLIDKFSINDPVVFSCGGGMPPGVNSENLKAFIKAVHL